MSIDLNNRVDSLVFLRFVAAVVVINFHYAKEIVGLGHFYTAGQQMVTLFFVLSGFVLGFSYGAKNEICISKFITSRFIKIAPLYFFGLGLAVLAFYICGKFIDLNTFVYNVFFIQSLIPSYALSFNYPAWFISTQIFLYILFVPILIQIKKIDLKKAFWLGLFFWLLTQIILTLLNSGEIAKQNPIIIRDIVHYNPLSHLCSFAFGIIGGIWFLKNRVNYQKNNIFIFVILVVLYILCLEYYPQLGKFLGLNIPFGASFFAPLSLAFILGLAIYGNFEFFSNRWLVLLGNASFAIYILHAPIHMIYEELFDLSMKSILDFNLYFVVTVFCGIIGHKLIEQKLSIAISKMLNR